MKDFYTNLFPEPERSHSVTRNMERGTWPHSTFPASMAQPPLRRCSDPTLHAPLPGRPAGHAPQSGASPTPGPLVLGGLPPQRTCSARS